MESSRGVPLTSADRLRLGGAAAESDRTDGATTPALAADADPGVGRADVTGPDGLGGGDE